jgi:hypothetical protein
VTWSSSDSPPQRIGATAESPVRMSNVVWHVATRRQATLWPPTRLAHRFEFVQGRRDTAVHGENATATVALPLSQFRTQATVCGETVRGETVATNQRTRRKIGSGRPICGIRSGLTWTGRRDRSGMFGLSIARRAYARRSSCRALAGSARPDRRSRCANPALAVQVSRPKPTPRRRPRSGHAGR